MRMPFIHSSNDSLHYKAISSSKGPGGSSSRPYRDNRTHTASVQLVLVDSFILSKSFSLVHKRFKQLPFLGAFHATDLFFNSYAPGGDLQDYIVRFVANLDPNGDTGITWPKWTTDSPKLLSFNDDSVPQNITEDTYREEAIDTLNAILLQYPL